MASRGLNVLLLGAGRMGGALLAGWQRAGLLEAPPMVIEPEASAEVRHAAERGVILLNPRLGESSPPSIAVVAVKPQALRTTLSDLMPRLSPGTTVLSIVAGARIATLQSLLGTNRPIVRAMPNLPASVGEGMTVACAASNVEESARQACAALLEAVGEVAWITDEGLLDAVTAVSGSGPAYVFLLAECLSLAGKAQGLAPDLAERLARRTVIGAGALLAAAKESPAELRASVTSPGGTTEAALETLMAKNGMKDLFEKAVAAATARARVLGGR